VAGYLAELQKKEHPGIIMKALVPALFITLCVCPAHATEYHVSKAGVDTNPGSKSKPFKTISADAQIAQPGDVITVHAGMYRERVNPPRGVTSDDKRIVYRAAPGEAVVIKGSEIIKGWDKVQENVWEAVLPNSAIRRNILDQSVRVLDHKSARCRDQYLGYREDPIDPRPLAQDRLGEREIHQQPSSQRDVDARLPKTIRSAGGE